MWHIRYICVNIDIPFMQHRSLQEKLERAEAREKELQHKVEELSDFVENASLPMQAVNGSGIVVWVNQAYLDMLGYTRGEYLNKHVSHFYDDPEATEEIQRRLLNKETLRNFYARLRRRNGEVCHVLIDSNACWKNGEFMHTRCFVRDVTEIKLECDRKAERIAALEQELAALKNQASGGHLRASRAA